MLFRSRKMSPDLNGKGTYTTDQKRLDPQYVDTDDPEFTKLEILRLERAKLERERLKEEKLQRDANDRNSNNSDKP